MYEWLEEQIRAVEQKKQYTIRPLSKETDDTVFEQLTAQVHRLKNLTVLDLSWCNQITNASLRAVIGLKNLTRLNLSWCRQITAAGLQALASLKNLKMLDLSGCSQIKAAELQAVAGLKNLTTLYLRGCNQITVTVLQTLSCLKYLTTLDLSWCHQITAAELHTLPSFKNLTTLYLNGCNQITAAGLQAFAAGPKKLRALYLSGCHQITATSLQALANGLKHLTTLDLSGCEQITAAGLQVLADGCPRLRKLHLLHTGVRNLPDALIQSADAQTIFKVLRDSLPFNEAKLVLLGDASHGKTNLGLALRRAGLGAMELEEHKKAGDDLAFRPTHDPTHDFEIAAWPVEVMRLSESKKRRVTVRVLDFAGQDVTHATHQFFLTRRCVYVLVLNAALPLNVGRVEYWLRQTWHFAGGSPVLIAVTQCDPDPRRPRKLDAAKLEKLVTELAGQVGAAPPTIIDGVSAKTMAGINALRAVILESVAASETLDTLMPPEFHDLRKWYEDPLNFNTFETLGDYQKRCREQFKITDPQRQRTYLRVLHEFAGVFHWGDEEGEEDESRGMADGEPDFKPARGSDGNPDSPCRGRSPLGTRPRADIWMASYVFDPDWLKDRVYTVAWDSKCLEKQKGILDLERVRTALREKGLEVGDEQQGVTHYLMVMRAMERFELAFPLECDRRWLLPACLSDSSVEGGSWPPIRRWEGEFQFLPESLVQRLMVRLHQDGHLKTEKVTYWRHGCWAYDETIGDPAQTTVARIEAKPAERRLVVETCGPADAADFFGRQICRLLEILHRPGRIEWRETLQAKTEPPAATPQTSPRPRSSLALDGRADPSSAEMCEPCKNQVRQVQEWVNAHANEETAIEGPWKIEDRMIQQIWLESEFLHDRKRQQQDYRAAKLMCALFDKSFPISPMEWAKKIEAPDESAKKRPGKKDGLKTPTLIEVGEAIVAKLSKLEKLCESLGYESADHLPSGDNLRKNFTFALDEMQAHNVFPPKMVPLRDAGQTHRHKPK